MIIKTKYRDIPFEDAIKCVSEAFKDESECSRENWEANRGQPIALIVPQAGNEFDRTFFKCDGPFYYRTTRDKSGQRSAVCPHLAEIGD